MPFIGVKKERLKSVTLKEAHVPAQFGKKRGKKGESGPRKGTYHKLP